MSNLAKVWLVIPAAGIGQRMQSSIPKQYIKIQNKTILEHTLDCFIDNNAVAGIVIVIAANDGYYNFLQLNQLGRPIFTVQGGADRAESVSRGLSFLSDKKKLSSDTWVMVHDAARPCLSKADLESLLDICNLDCVGGLLASPVKDTMKRSKISDVDGCFQVSHTESREQLWHAQTPQMFRLGMLQNALNTCEKSGVEITDECSAMEYIGEAPLLLESVDVNIKATSPSDLDFIEFLLRTKQSSKRRS